MSEELTILTRGQEALYKYLLFSEAPISEKTSILDRMTEVYTGPDDQKYLQMIRSAAEDTGQIVSYEYLVDKDFPYHLDHVGGEKTLSTAESHLTLASEAELKFKKSASSDLMAFSRHLLECKDPAECAKGQCPSLPKRNPMEVLDRLSMSLAGGLQQSRTLRFQEIYDERKNRSLGAQTFIQPFDEKIQGLEPGNLFVVAGWTGSFKTTFALNMVHQNAVLNGYNAVFITSEIPKEILYLYLLCRHSYEAKFASNGPIARMGTQKATLTAEEEKFMRDVVEPDLLTNPDYGKILILDETDFPSFTKAGIKSKILSLDFDVDILVYDYVQLIKFIDDAQEPFGKTNPINRYVRMFADLAMHLYGDRHKFLSMVLSQVNREGWKKAVENDGEYDITCLAEANELERSASYILSVFSDQDLKESGEIKAQLLKHRGGESHEDPVLTPIDPRYLAFGHGIEGFGEVAQSDMSGLLATDDTNDLFGGF